MSFLTSTANGLGVDSKNPYMETLAAFNDAGKRQVFAINVICIDYYGVIFIYICSWQVKNSVPLGLFCFLDQLVVLKGWGLF